MTLDPSTAYREPAAQPSQGDILRFVPHLVMRPPFRVIRKKTLTGGRPEEVCFPCDPEPPPEGPLVQGQGGEVIKFDYDRGELVASRCWVDTAIVLSHGCDIDKNKKDRLIALVCPLAPKGDEDKERIRGNRVKNTFYLPAYKDVLAESFVDFRKVTCIEPSFLKEANKIASMTVPWVKALQLCWFSSVSRCSFNVDGTGIAIPDAE